MGDRGDANNGGEVYIGDCVVRVNKPREYNK